MSRVQKVLTLEITPEQFLNSCSVLELMEVEIMIQSPRFQNLMAQREPIEVKPIEISDGQN